LVQGFPYITDSLFLSYLNDVINKYGIDCIFPAHDSVSVFLSNHSDEIDAQVIIADAKTTNICRSKKDTYEYFAEYDFIPKMFKQTEEVTKYPVFVKPEIGQGSVGAKKINNKNELIESIENNHNLIICEYLSGMEYTIDCFTDQKGNLRVAKIRDRERIRSGISVRSKLIASDTEILNIAQILNEKLNFKGAWFFQVKMDDEGKYRLMEISPRIPGTMGVTRNTGINFSMLTLFIFWGYEIDIIENEYEIEVDRAFYSAYRINYEYEHVYIDYDDTLVINHRVNEELLRFVYQTLNRGKKIHLLTKHDGNIYETLKKMRIAREIFEDIKVIPKSDEKSNYIKEKKAIFIDDSFAERKKVHREKGIPVFDVDMVESLIDWRV
jgi:hypothetical protein